MYRLVTADGKRLNDPIIPLWVDGDDTSKADVGTFAETLVGEQESSSGP